jgi:hypothetical protein
MERLGLTEAIRMMRSELSEAVAAAADEKLHFEVGEIELEFQVAVELSGNAGVKFWVVDVGAGASRSQTHVVRVPLRPVLADGRPVLTGADDEIPPAPDGR